MNQTLAILATHAILAIPFAAATGCTSSPKGTEAGSATPDASASSFSPSWDLAEAGSSVPGLSEWQPRDAQSAPDALPPCDHVPVQKNCTAGWCRISPGCFIMGSPKDEWGRGKYSEPQVHVTFTRPIEIQQFETTREEWVSLGLPDPSTETIHCKDCSEPGCPVGNVNWFDAVAFTNRYSEARGRKPCYVLEGCTGDIGLDGEMVCTNVRVNAPSLYECEGYRLPTEAEWEYSIRAGTTTPLYNGQNVTNDEGEYCFPDPNLEAIAWVCGTNPEPYSTHPGGQKHPNAWGLFDMAGNAGEWVNDRFDGFGYGEGPLVDPFGQLLVGPEFHGVVRGGMANGFNLFGRSAKRLEGPRDAHAPCIGFRMVRTLL